MLLSASVSQETETEELLIEPVTVEYFYQEGCPVCARVSIEILPQIEELLSGLHVLSRYDTGVDTNYLKLARYQENLDIDANESAIFVVEGRYPFAGWKAISEGLVSRIEECILARLEGQETEAGDAGQQEYAGDDESLLLRRLRGFALPGVVAAGLIDGINPCAISTLVFFLSMLSVLKVRGAKLLMVGSAFCVASFLTYTALGFGLLRALHMFSGFRTLQRGFEIVLLTLLIILAFLSFRDALRYGSSGKPRDVTLQLPSWVKERIRRVIHSGLESGSILTGSLLTGVAVTGLESVCTGQVYVPTLVMVIKSGKSTWPALGYLLLYNVSFISPLVAAFVLTYQGLKTQRLLEWSKKNVVVSKVLLGCFFLAMALLFSILMVGIG